MAMMISKFHKLIASKVFWGIFALVISVSFVGVSIPGCQNRNAQGSAQREGQLAGKLFGEDVSRMEFGQAYRRTYVSYTIMFGRAIQVTDEIDTILRKEAWQRIATLKKAHQLGMTVTPAQTIAMIQRQPIFQNQQTGQFDKNAYDAFVQGFLPQNGMTSADFENMLSEQVLIEKISSIPAQGGIVLDAEILKAFHLYTDMLTVEYASVSRSLASAPKVTEEDAKNYFEQNQEEFRMPEKVKVDYVQFAVADYTEKVEVAEEMVAGFYENNKQRYLKELAEDADPAAAPEFKLLEEVREEIVARITQELALLEAAEQADILVSELADESITFAQTVEALGLTIVDKTRPFTQTDSVKGIDPTAPFQRAAFALQDDATHYYSDPVVGRDTVYVLSLSKKYDSFLPSFDNVRDDATEAAKITADEKAYAEKAEQIQADLQTALKAGTSFEDAIKPFKLELQKTAPFNVTTTLEDEFGSDIKANAILLEQGTLTELISTPNEFIVAYVAEKVPGDAEATLPAMRAELASRLSNDKASRLVAAWREALLEEADFEDLTDDQS
jgi:peptidyl-prolyl cis-trans isomerase D